MWLDFGFWTAVIALALYAILPVLRNTIVGLQGVDPHPRRGRPRRRACPAAGVLLRVELPLAVPVIMAGVRTALVLLVGTATLATFINAGGLGAHPADRHLAVPLLRDGLRAPCWSPCSRCSSSGWAGCWSCSPGRRESERCRTTTHRCTAALAWPSLALCRRRAAALRLRPGHRRRLRARPASSPDRVKDVKSLDGAAVSIGSKNFSENVLLGKMAIILLQSAGATVTDLTNIPGSASARQAMLDGQIQAMWEYTGTGWITYLGHDKPIPDEQKQYTAVRDEDLKTNDARLAAARTDEQHLRVRDHPEGLRTSTRSPSSRS